MISKVSFIEIIFLRFFWTENHIVVKNNLLSQRYDETFTKSKKVTKT